MGATLTLATKKEVAPYIENLKNNEFTAENNISAEMLKQGGKAILLFLFVASEIS